jgi:hypothetical protein
MTISRLALDTPDVPLDWPRRFPYHPLFGPCSTVPVPLPSVFPSAVSPLLAVPLAPGSLDGTQPLFDSVPVSEEDHLGDMRCVIVHRQIDVMS